MLHRAALWSYWLAIAPPRERYLGELRKAGELLSMGDLLPVTDETNLLVTGLLYNR
jgi:hypothetical protein